MLKISFTLFILTIQSIDCEEPPRRLCFAPCDDNDDPVCSNYGNTHKNLCKLTCESNEEFVHEGMCRQCKCAWTNEKVCSTKDQHVQDMNGNMMVLVGNKLSVQTNKSQFVEQTKIMKNKRIKINVLCYNKVVNIIMIKNVEFVNVLKDMNQYVRKMVKHIIIYVNRIVMDKSLIMMVFVKRKLVIAIVDLVI